MAWRLLDDCSLGLFDDSLNGFLLLYEQTQQGGLETGRSNQSRRTIAGGTELKDSDSGFRWFVCTLLNELSNKEHFTNFLAVGFAGVYFGLVLSGSSIPERFETIVIMILSFYFGTKMKG